MKTKLTFLLFLFISFYSYSQKYIPIVEENKEWSTLTVWTSDWPDTTYYTTFNKFEGDTTIGEYQYLKVYETQNQELTDWILKGCIREDSTRKVWYKPIDNYERIKYDFGMQAGDTILIENYPDLILDSIKEISVNGSVRQSFYLSNEYATEIWIEGIGSLLGILNSGLAGTAGGYSLLLCLHENSELIWQNSDYAECWLVSGINKINDNLIKVNILTDFNNNIKIENNELTDIYIEIYNLLGQMIFFKRVESNSSIYLNHEKFNKGIYLCRIITDEKKIKTIKIIF